MRKVQINEAIDEKGIDDAAKLEQVLEELKELRLENQKLRDEVEKYERELKEIPF